MRANVPGMRREVSEKRFVVPSSMWNGLNRTDERIQVCVSGVRAAYNSGLSYERRPIGVPDLFSKNRRSASPVISGFEVYPLGGTGRQAPAPGLSSAFWAHPPSDGA